LARPTRRSSSGQQASRAAIEKAAQLARIAALRQYISALYELLSAIQSAQRKLYQPLENNQEWRQFDDQYFKVRGMVSREYEHRPGLFEQSNAAKLAGLRTVEEQMKQEAEELQNQILGQWRLAMLSLLAQAAREIQSAIRRAWQEIECLQPPKQVPLIVESGLMTPPANEDPIVLLAGFWTWFFRPFALGARVTSTVVTSGANRATVTVSGNVATVVTDYVHTLSDRAFFNAIIQQARSQGATSLVVRTGAVHDMNLAMRLGRYAQSGRTFCGGRVTVTSARGTLQPSFQIAWDTIPEVTP
jgi:hypothetical protein